MASIKLSLSSKKGKDCDESEIHLRLSIDRTHVYRVKTGLYIQRNSWNKEKQRVIIPRMKTAENVRLTKFQGEIDALCNNIKNAVSSTPLDLISKVWLDALVGSLTGKEDCATAKQVEEESFSNQLERFIDVQCKSKRRADHFRCMERMLKRFCLYANVSLSLATLTAERLAQFEAFLQIEHTFFDAEGNCIKHKRIYEQEPCKVVPKKRGLNAVNEIMRRLRTFYNWAVRNKLITNTPFTIYKVPVCTYGTPFFLTSEERDRLFAYDFTNNPSLGVQRDIFVFQSNVGMRVGDLYELTSANIVNGALEYVANKTRAESGKTIRVPLSTQANTIIERYKSEDRVELFPFISIQKYNVAIKAALKLAGIDRMVTVLNPTTRIEEQHPIWKVASSHMARRNFIGNLYNKTQDPNAIGSMTGHAEGSKAFARYRSIDDTVKKTLIDML